jgi:hypothetical protein
MQFIGPQKDFVIYRISRRSSESLNVVLQSVLHYLIPEIADFNVIRVFFISLFCLGR